MRSLLCVLLSLIAGAVCAQQPVKIRVAWIVPATTEPDETIRQHLLAELERQKWAPAGFLNVTVQNGAVELWGTITDERERQALIVAAQNVPGVKDVRDHLVWVEPMSGIGALAPAQPVNRNRGRSTPVDPAGRAPPHSP